MDGKEFYKYAKPCNDQNIFIYPTCSNTGRHKIVIREQNRSRTGFIETTGKEIYKQTAEIREVVVKTPTGDRKVKITIPSVWDKIFDLYKAICEKKRLIEHAA